LKITQTEAQVTKQRNAEAVARIADLKETFEVRKQEMAFTAKIQDIYGQIDILYAAQNSAYITMDGLWQQFYAIEDIAVNAPRRKEL
jgi:uncharacterized coiled-coil DUF342 family protein